MKNYILYFLPILALFQLHCKSSPSIKEDTKSQEHKIKLEHKVIQPRVSVQNPPLLVLLHGYGSNEEDLLSFSRVLDEKLMVISARAPGTIAPGKFKWYDLNVQTGEMNDEQEVESRKLIVEFIDAVVKKYKSDSNNIILGGFSQGAIMALSVGLYYPEKVKGIAVLSGKALTVHENSQADPASLKNVSFFVSHGTKDNIIPYEQAEKINTYLSGLNANLTFKSYESAHTINQENLRDLKEWVGSLLH